MIIGMLTIPRPAPVFIPKVVIPVKQRAKGEVDCAALGTAIANGEVVERLTADQVVVGQSIVIRGTGIKVNRIHQRGRKIDFYGKNNAGEETILTTMAHYTVEPAKDTILSHR